MTVILCFHSDGFLESIWATLIGVTVENFPDCHRKTVTSFVKDCLKTNTQNPKTSDTLKLHVFWESLLAGMLVPSYLRCTGNELKKWFCFIWNTYIKSWTISSVAQSCPTLCDSMDCSQPGFPVHHQLLELAQTLSIESVMPSNHVILCHPLLLLASVFPSVRVFSNESVLRIGWPKYELYLCLKT